MRRTLRSVECFAKRLQSRGVGVVAANITKQSAELFECRRIDSAVMLEAVMRPCTKLVQTQAISGHTDNWNVEVAPFHHRLQRREDLLICQIARCAEENQCIRL